MEEKAEEGLSFHDRRIILTVGHTLILDLQVLVRPWAGVREDVWTRDYDALGPIVASEKDRGKKAKKLSLKNSFEQKKEQIESLKEWITINILAVKTSN